MITIFNVTQFGKPVQPPSQRLNEKGPRHADMLRYDLAFCNPEEPHQVVFPVFDSKFGKTTQSITYARWRSFCMELTPGVEVLLEHCRGWITYVHPRDGFGCVDYGKLAPQSMAEFMLEGRLKFAARHRDL